jgi:hypothetical protein
MGKEGRRVNMVQMYINEKMIPIQTISGIRGRGG